MDTETQPMQSARVFAGKYEVLGTSTACVVRQESFITHTFWALYSDGEFVKSFPTKRRALQFCQEHPEL